MQPLSIVIASNDCQAAAQLAASLNHHFGSVSVAGTLEEVRHAIPKHRAQVAVVDLELASVDDVQRLAREFSHTSIVCTHRIPDEEMWASALTAGAVDCCYASDVACIVEAVSRNVRLTRSKAA
jgi:hypothetical protein